MFVHPISDEFFVANGLFPHGVTIYANAASVDGNTTPTRTRSGAATQLTQIVGLDLDTTRN